MVARGTFHMAGQWPGNEGGTDPWPGLPPSYGDFPHQPDPLEDTLILPPAPLAVEPSSPARPVPADSPDASAFYAEHANALVGDGLWDELAEAAEKNASTGKKGSRKRRVLQIFAMLIVSSVLVCAGAGFWFFRQLYPGNPGSEVMMSVPEGTSLLRLGTLLEEEGVITSAFAFRLYTRVRSIGTISSGMYALQAHSDIDDVIDVLRQGPIRISSAITLPEGTVLSQMIERVDQTDLLGGDAFRGALESGEIRSVYLPDDVGNLEGFLFPDTYQIDETVSEEDFLRRLVSTFDRVAGEVGIVEKAADLALTPYEVVIVASMVEKEARVDGDRAKIARVIYNRHARGMPLGIDATLLYSFGPDPDFSAIDWESTDPYNTRRMPGFPPTPISNPGRASLEAALNPAEGDWLYYVLTDASGEHTFTSSYDAFLRAKADAKRRGIF